MKEARSAVSASQVDGWLAAAAAEKVPLALLADRTPLDPPQHPPGGHVVDLAGDGEDGLALASMDGFDAIVLDVLLPRLQRDARLAQKPVAVAREPDRRPHSDPRSFLPAVGQRVRLALRNGFSLEESLTSVGPYDLVRRRGHGGAGAAARAPVGAGGDAAAPTP